MRKVHWLGIALVGAAGFLPYATGCSASEEDASDGEEADEGELPGPSRGSAVVLSADDRVAVMVNRDVGSVSVFSLSYSREGYSRDGKDSFLPSSHQEGGDLRSARTRSPGRS